MSTNQDVCKREGKPTKHNPGTTETPSPDKDFGVFASDDNISTKMIDDFKIMCKS